MITALLFLAFYHQNIRQLYHVIKLFDEDRIVQNFVSMDGIFPVVTLERSGPVHEFGQAPGELPEHFDYFGEKRSINEWMENTNTLALLVVRGNDIVYEGYFLGTTATDRRISWSMSKSVTSAAFGIAVEEGYIPDLEAPVTDFVPELAGTGYDGVKIKNVLQMSSGVEFNEDYSDYNSDINRFGRTIAMGGSFDGFAASLQSSPDMEQGTHLHYVSIDTHVLGMVLRAATGISIKEFFEEKLWSALGMEQDAYFIADGLGEPMVLGGLNMVTRDYARFAMMMRDNGRMLGRQVVPESWVEASITPDAPHLMPGKRDNSGTDLGYGYQWWLPVPDADSMKEFMGIGIYGQFMYINRDLDVVIIKNSADLDFQANNFESDTIAYHAFRSIARAVAVGVMD